MSEEQKLQARIAELEKECAFLGKQIAVQRDNRLAEFKAILENVLRPSCLYLVEEIGEAIEYLDENIGAKAEDPGYFSN